MPTAIPMFPHPNLYAGDLNCWCVTWVYSISPDGEILDSCAATDTHALLQAPNGVASFSHRWNVGTNPDLAIGSVGHDNRLPARGVLGTFPRSHHRPYIITPLRFEIPAYSDPAKPWNFLTVD